MLTTDDITNGFNGMGIDTPEKFAAFLKPSAISAQLADYDGQLASLAVKRDSFLTDIQTEQERIIAVREEVRAKLQGEK